MRRQTTDRTVTADPWHLQIDRRRGVAYCGGEVLVLRAKAWEALLYLAARPAEVVSIDDLRRAVWRDVFVSRKTVHNVVAELRAAILGDRRPGPGPIETVKGRGYRLRVRVGHLGVSAETATELRRDGVLLPRARLSGALDDVWNEALAHGVRIALLVGEPGAGKSTLLRWMVEAIHGTETPITRAAGTGVALGSAVDRDEVPEPYGPLLMATAALLAERPSAAALLRRLAPTWLLQFPGYVDAAEADGLTRLCAGSSPARRHREGVAFFEALAAEAPLLLAIEDLQWADADTLDVLAALARSARRVPLCITGTLRRDRGANAGRHATGLENLRRVAVEIGVVPFTPDEVRAYLHLRLDSATLPAELCGLMVERTSGNPLLLQSVCRQFVVDGYLTRDAAGWHLAPDATLRGPVLAADVTAVVASGMHDLTPELVTAVEAASLIGETFSPAAVAQVLSAPEPAIAHALEALVGHQIMRRTPGDDYAFVHDVHRQVVRHDIHSERRRQMHAAVAAYLIDRPISAREPYEPRRIAEHLSAGGDAQRAAEYFERAAHLATVRLDYTGAARHLEHAVTCFARLPPTPDSERRQGHLLLLLANLAGLQLSSASPLVLSSYAAAAAVFDRHGDRVEAFRARLGITFTHILRGACREAHVAAARLLADAEHGVPGMRAAATAYAGIVDLMRGDVPSACAQLGESLREPVADDLPRMIDLRPMTQFALGTGLAVSGDLDGARAHQAAGRTSTRSDLLPATQPLYLLQDAVIATLVGDLAVTAERVAAARELCDTYAFFHLATIGDFLRHWAAARAAMNDGALAGMEAALTAQEAAGNLWMLPYLGTLLAECYLDAGRVEPAQDCVERSAAWIETGGERFALAEVQRLRGTCLVASAAAAQRGQRSALQRQAVEELHRAAATAAAQGAGLFERRVRVQLDRLDPRRPTDDARSASKSSDPA